MADQNNFYPQQPQYIDPQGNNPFGQPQYTAAPVPPAQPASTEPEPEVIIQEVGFADYGFSEGDSIMSGHDFGNILDDDNSEESVGDDMFDAFNSQTPNFDPAAVEAAGRAAAEADKSTYMNTTFNYDPAAVEQASKVETAFDKEVFSNATAVEERESTLSEHPAFETRAAAPAAPVDFLASMKGAFVSMNGAEPAPAYTAAPAPAPEPEPAPAPAPIPEPAPAPAPAQTVEPIQVPAAPAVAAPAFSTEEPDLIPEPISPAQPDTVTNAPAYSTVNDLSNTVPADEKGPEYWENIDKMLGNFEPKAAKTEPAAEPEQTVAPVPPAAIVEEPEEPEEEAKSGFPFSESAQADDLKPEALPKPAVPFDEVPDEEVYDELEEEDDSEEEIDLFVDNKAAKAAVKAEEKAARARAKAEKRANDNRSFSQKIFPSKGDAAADKAIKIAAILIALALLAGMVFGIYALINSQVSKSRTSKLAATVAAAEKGNLTWKDIYAKYPGINFPSGMQVKFADLYAENQDLVGWIKIPGLSIDYPVLQASDDNYYQNHNFYKKSDKSGSIFLSSKNSAGDELDQNTVIYGHALKKSGRMFSNLQDYKKAETFKKNPIIEFDTLYSNYKFKIISVFVTNGAAAQDNGFILDYTFANLATTESLAGYLAEINQRRLYSTGVDILPTDKLICLSTASFEFENARLVIVGRMLRAGESEEIDASKVVVNENPRYPQAWYDANKVTNPYDKYSHWKPTN